MLAVFFLLCLNRLHQTLPPGQAVKAQQVGGLEDSGSPGPAAAVCTVARILSFHSLPFEMWKAATGWLVPFIAEGLLPFILSFISQLQ